MQRLTTSQGNFNVYVNLLPNSRGKTFHLSFVDRTNKTYSIFMENDGFRWKIISLQNLPDWVLQLEEQFNLLIEKELSQDKS